MTTGESPRGFTQMVIVGQGQRLQSVFRNCIQIIDHRVIDSQCSSVKETMESMLDFSKGASIATPCIHRDNGLHVGFEPAPMVKPQNMVARDMVKRIAIHSHCPANRDGCAIQSAPGRATDFLLCTYGTDFVLQIGAAKSGIWRCSS